MIATPLFHETHEQILGYFEDEIVRKCSAWGLGAYEQVRTSKYKLASDDAVNIDFAYAVSTAVIAGEFGEHASVDYFGDETVIDLTRLDMSVDEIRGLLNDDVSQEQIELLADAENVDLQDMWEAVCAYKMNVYDGLKTHYAHKGVDDTDYRIFASLMAIYEESENGEKMPLNISDARKMAAYMYVSNGFQY